MTFHYPRRPALRHRHPGASQYNVRSSLNGCQYNIAQSYNQPSRPSAYMPSYTPWSNSWARSLSRLAVQWTCLLLLLLLRRFHSCIRRRLRRSRAERGAIDNTLRLQAVTRTRARRPYSFFSEAELDFSTFESARRRAYRPAPPQPVPANAAAAGSLASRHTRRSDGSALSRKSVVIRAEMIGVVNRMTDALLDVMYHRFSRRLHLRSLRRQMLLLLAR